jgi:hypothetical protein
MLSRRISGVFDDPTVVTNGLIGYWHYKWGFEGGKWINISPNTIGDYIGVSASGPTLVDDGVSFPGGTNNYIRVDPFITLPPQSTVEIIGNYQDTNTPGSYILAMVKDNSTDHGIRIDNYYDYHNRIGLAHGSYGYRGYATIPGYGVPVHFTLTSQHTTDTDRATNRVYVDTVEGTSTSDTNVSRFFGNTMTFGAINRNWGYNTAEFIGKIYAIRIYDRILSKAEINQNFILGPHLLGMPEPTITTDGLIGYWHYNQGVEGSLWRNISPHTSGQHDGIINGASLQSDGMYFDGNSTVSIVPANTEPGAPFSIEIIYSLEEPITAVGNRLYTFIDTLEDGYGSVLSAYHDVNLYRVRSHWGRLGSNFIANTTHSTNTVNSFVLTFEGETTGEYRFYKDGKLLNITSGPLDARILTRISGELTLGANQLGDDPLKGKIISLKLYNRKISELEIKKNLVFGTKIGLG